MIQSLWNPFRDWNFAANLISARLSGFKASETLLGIETLVFLFVLGALAWFKASETLLGIETFAVLVFVVPLFDSKPLKPF